MHAAHHFDMPAHLRVVVTLAHLLQRLEASGKPIAAEQYRYVARRLADELRKLDSDTALDAVLQAFPAAAELYENLRYEHAGLCRAPLEQSLKTEMQARAVIGRAARAGSTNRS
jgi:hemoglobin-like flavoprotein